MHILNGCSIRWSRPGSRAASRDTDARRRPRAGPLIAAGRDVLITAPTGSGKTLAAFLVVPRRAGRARRSTGTLAGRRRRSLYVSPLKALSQRRPAATSRRRWPRSRAVAAELGIALAGDPHRGAHRRHARGASGAKLAKRPPHILVTTPESLYILLTAERAGAALRSVRTVIVDEIHAVAGDKRGAHLALSLERLDALVSRPAARRSASACRRR